MIAKYRLIADYLMKGLSCLLDGRVALTTIVAELEKAAESNLPNMYIFMRSPLPTKLAVIRILSSLCLVRRSPPPLAISFDRC